MRLNNINRHPVWKFVGLFWWGWVGIGLVDSAVATCGAFYAHNLSKNMAWMTNYILFIVWYNYSSMPWPEWEFRYAMKVWKWMNKAFLQQSAVITRCNITWQCIQHCSDRGIYYSKTSNISHTLGNKIVDHSDVVGASPVGAAPTTSSFSSWHLASRDSAKKAARQCENLLSVGIWCVLYLETWRKWLMKACTHKRHPIYMECL